MNINKKRYMIESWEERLKQGELLTEQEIEILCGKAMEIFIREPNVISIPSPAQVCGDIHGQFFDLINLFKLFGYPASRRYVFLGDYVDRGFHGVETLSLLLIYKVLYPDNIFILRGNHESISISKSYGFYDEVNMKYGNSNVWRMFCEVFRFMNVACIVGGRIFCVHGGVSERTSINTIQGIDRFQKTTEHGLISDLLWSDPIETKPKPILNKNISHDPIDFYGSEKNKRGSGIKFGVEVARSFCEANDLVRIIRSHQLAEAGYKVNFFDKTCITIWSAPNYCYRYGNLASVFSITNIFYNSDSDFRIFKHVKKQKPGFENFISIIGRSKKEE
ncbi:Serine/threonine-protein phosphatase 4 catalytic subunit 1 [Cucumispora dikerogammari]|nr:Serine/threonine-protein phosphatase 4 catalytic subunit 1 [Cucumispora dikerogammari]